MWLRAWGENIDEDGARVDLQNHHCKTRIRHQTPSTIFLAMLSSFGYVCVLKMLCVCQIFCIPIHFSCTSCFCCRCFLQKCAINGRRISTCDLIVDRISQPVRDFAGRHVLTQQFAVSSLNAILLLKLTQDALQADLSEHLLLLLHGCLSRLRAKHGRVQSRTHACLFHDDRPCCCSERVSSS